MNILFTLALNRWQETGRDSDNSRHDLRDTGRTGLIKKKANVKLGMGNVLELFRENKATKRGKIFSFTEQSINKMNLSRVTKGSGKLILSGLAALI